MHLGLRLDSRQSRGMCTLVGDLGVVKQLLTQGIAEGLGITEPINSPTFTIVQVYRMAGCRFIISMYTGLVTLRRWMK